jgi:hypothetical protein
LPKRVLKIQEDAYKISLFIPEDTVKDEYATLSHCWGGQSTLTLTENTMQSLLEGIVTKDLPKSIQDAVWITHRIGIQYLWIDSLCIMQDDLNDWIGESAKMDKIYSSSSCTIAATRASNGSEGFLGEREARRYIKIPYQYAETSSHCLASELPLKFAESPSRILEFEDEPLSKRGWALQERYVSQRTLNFCKSQIIFDCRHGSWCEDDLLEIDTPKLNFQKYNGPKGYMVSRSDWLSVVTSYSRRHLTDARDKLPALAGLAARLALVDVDKEVSCTANNQYLAGLWVDDLVTSLAWDIDQHSSPGVRLSFYRAPSWSWASIDGPVTFRLRRLSPLAIIKDVYVDLESISSPFGRINFGWIRLKARIFKTFMASESTQLYICDRETKLHVYVSWDSEKYLAPEENTKATDDRTNLFVVLLGWDEVTFTQNSKPETLGTYALVVKPVNRPQVSLPAGIPGYERVGLGLPHMPSKEFGMQMMKDKWKVMEDSDDLNDILLL